MSEYVAKSQANPGNEIDASDGAVTQPNNGKEIIKGDEDESQLQANSEQDTANIDADIVQPQAKTATDVAKNDQSPALPRGNIEMHTAKGAASKVQLQVNSETTTSEANSGMVITKSDSDKTQPESNSGTDVTKIDLGKAQANSEMHIIKGDPWKARFLANSGMHVAKSDPGKTQPKASTRTVLALGDEDKAHSEANSGMGAAKNDAHHEVSSEINVAESDLHKAQSQTCPGMDGAKSDIAQPHANIGMDIVLSDTDNGQANCGMDVAKIGASKVQSQTNTEINIAKCAIHINQLKVNPGKTQSQGNKEVGIPKSDGSIAPPQASSETEVTKSDFSYAQTEANGGLDIAKSGSDKTPAHSGRNTESDECKAHSQTSCVTDIVKSDGVIAQTSREMHIFKSDAGKAKPQANSKTDLFESDSGITQPQAISGVGMAESDSGKIQLQANSEIDVSEGDLGTAEVNGKEVIKSDGDKYQPISGMNIAERASGKIQCERSNEAELPKEGDSQLPTYCGMEIANSSSLTKSQVAEGEKDVLNNYAGNAQLQTNTANNDPYKGGLQVGKSGKVQPMNITNKTQLQVTKDTKDTATSNEGNIQAISNSGEKGVIVTVGGNIQPNSENKPINFGIKVDPQIRKVINPKSEKKIPGKRFITYTAKMFGKKAGTRFQTYGGDKRYENITASNNSQYQTYRKFVSGGPQNDPDEKYAKIFRKDGKDVKTFWCDICKVFCTSAVNLQMHFLGNKHKRIEEVLKWNVAEGVVKKVELLLTETTEPKSVERKIVVTKTVERKTVKPKTVEKKTVASKIQIPTTVLKPLEYYLNKLKLKRAIVGLNYVVEYHLQHSKRQFECELCHHTSDLSIFIQHIIGSRHMLRYLKRRHPDTLKGQNWILCKADCKRLNRKALEIEKLYGRGSVTIVRKKVIPKVNQQNTAEQTAVELKPEAEKSEAASAAVKPEPKPMHSEPIPVRVVTRKFPASKILEKQINSYDVKERIIAAVKPETKPVPSEPIPVPVVTDKFSGSEILEKQITSLNVKEPIIGLDFLVEYHYLGQTETMYFCELCNFELPLRCIVSHLYGMKHRIGYVKRRHPDLLKLSATKHKFIIKENISEIEKRDGRGNVRIIYGQIQHEYNEKSTAVKRPAADSNKQPDAKVPRQSSTTDKPNQSSKDETSQRLTSDSKTKKCKSSCSKCLSKLKDSKDSRGLQRVSLSSRHEGDRLERSSSYDRAGASSSHSGHGYSSRGKRIESDRSSKRKRSESRSERDRDRYSDRYISRRQSKWESEYNYKRRETLSWSYRDDRRSTSSYSTSDSDGSTSDSDHRSYSNPRSDSGRRSDSDSTSNTDCKYHDDEERQTHYQPKDSIKGEFIDYLKHFHIISDADAKQVEALMYKLSNGLVEYRQKLQNIKDSVEKSIGALQSSADVSVVQNTDGSSSHNVLTPNLLKSFHNMDVRAITATLTRMADNNPAFEGIRISTLVTVLFKMGMLRKPRKKHQK
uniref:Uncharacterized LOC103186355 n=1 Tax=Callorhinchus milii TaxID=7868 RepID=A0A4W3JHM4_CALMI